MDNSEMYDEEYFLRGKQSGKSLYENYRYLPNLTIPMVQAIISNLGITKEQTILDFGCARGYVVKAFRILGYQAWGTDASKWAIENCDPEVKPYVMDTNRIIYGYDWIIAKDVLEHVRDVDKVIPDLMNIARVGVFAVVPLSAVDHEQYVVHDYEKDVTHIHRLTLSSWVRMFLQPGWTGEASYRMVGVKDNYYQPGWEMGNGFIVARRGR